MRSSEPLPDDLGYDSRLVRTRLGEWFLCIPLPLSVSENQAPVDDVWTDGIISLDPGVRTFVTGYDPSGWVCEGGKNDIGRIYRLCHVLDKLQSRWSQKDVRHRKRYRLQKAGRRIRLKIRNLVDEFHKKLATWLCENYRVVLLPEFETSKMIRRGQRKIGSRTVRSMVTWSHYRFRQRLIAKSREYPWCRVVLCNESYTSKTCTNCGELHHSLGGSKVFSCPSCGFVIDRDINGARNILLRYLSNLDI
jgi:putative transposase